MIDPELTVLVTVHAPVDPGHFRAALESIAGQTVRPAEVILVEDGPLPDGLRRVIAGTPGLRVFALPQNMGSAAASQRGLDEVRTPWVARQDSDDISMPTRFAEQLDLARRTGSDVVGAAVVEFTGDAERGLGVRAMPAGHEEILRYARTNNPVNNPTLLARTDAVREVGGYRAVLYQEDYDLMIRLLAGGFRFHNLPEPLVYFRVGDAQFRRRRHRGFWRSEAAVQQTLVRAGLVSRPRAIVNYAARSTYRLLPASVMRAVYPRLFRS